MAKKTFDPRIGEKTRKTKETDITCRIDLDGSGNAEIDSGIGFFDHMLESFAKHGFFDLNLKCEGDLLVDGHHTVEDCGIVLNHNASKSKSPAPKPTTCAASPSITPKKKSNRPTDTPSSPSSSSSHWISSRNC